MVALTHKIKILYLLTFLQIHNCVFINFTQDIMFFLYTKDLGKYPQILIPNDNETLQLSDFKSSRKTIILIHEWCTGQRSIHITPIKNEYLKLENVNIIIIDWHNEAMLAYPSARKLVKPIGNFIAKFLQFLIDAGDAKASDFHIIGYGLGAHIGGCVAKRLNKVHKLTALNPDTNLFNNKDIDIIKPDDADCVYIFCSFELFQTNKIITEMGNTLFLIAHNKTEFNLGIYYAHLIGFINATNNMNDLETEQKCVKGYFYMEELIPNE